MTEADARLIGEALAAPGECFSPVKCGPGGVATSLARDFVVFSLGGAPGVLAETMRIRVPSTLYNYEPHPRQPLFLLLLKDLPISLYSRGNVISTYLVLNHVDEVKAPLAACFEEGGRGFWTGLGRSVYRFDVESRAARMVRIAGEGVRDKTLISAIGTQEGLVAVGTYSKLTYILSDSSPTPVSILEGQQGGLIQCTFAFPYLYTGGRCDDSVFCWDLRRPESPVNTLAFYREHKTQQRVLFAVEDEDRLAVGNADGSVYRYKRTTGELDSYFMAHFDAVNSVQLADTLLVTSAGQRHYFEEEPEPPKSAIRIWTIGGGLPLTSMVSE